MKRSSEKMILTVMLTICMLFSNTARASAMEQGTEATAPQAAVEEQGAADTALQTEEEEQDIADTSTQAEEEEQDIAETSIQAEEEEQGAADPEPAEEAVPVGESVPPEAEAAPDEISEEESTEESAEESTENPDQLEITEPAESGEGDGNILAREDAEQQEFIKDPAYGLSADGTSGSAAGGHYLAFASDLHGQSGTLENAMAGFPSDTEYVSIIGDLVGERGGDAPEYRAEDVYERIQGIFESIKKEQVSIIWADHDAGVINQDNIVKCEGGYTSGQIYEGKNSDGSTAYYIYAIGFNDMRSGGSISQTAANQFKEWIRDKDETIPTLVLCHVPLVAKRGDNFGASYWNEALNFAATGVEGISTDQDSAEIIRNVIYLCGHNHTVDQTEYLFLAGTSMNVQIDASSATSTGTEEGQRSSSESSTGTHHGHHKQEAQGVLSNIYYNSLVPGYLKTSGNATLMSITEELINLTKYNGGRQVSLGTDGESGETLPTTMEIKRIRWGEPGYIWADDLSSVTAFRSGINTSALYQSETAVTVYEVIREATGSEEGLIAYVASFTNPAFEKQIRTEIIPATGEKAGDSSDDSSEEETKSVLPRTSTNTKSAEDSETEPVPTGDEESAILWICLALAAGAGLVMTKRNRVA